MVERTNPMFKILFGNTSIGNAKSLDDLNSSAATKAIGVFDFDTNTSFINTTIPQNLHRMYFAEKAPNGSILRSPGEYIDVKGIYDVRRVIGKLPVAQSWDMTLNSDTCSEDYGIRFNLFNGETMHVDGVNPLVKSFVVAPNCTGGTCSCPEANCVNTAFKLYRDINADPDGLFTATIGYQANPTGLSTGLNYTPLNPYGVTAVTDENAWAVLVADSTTKRIDTNGDGDVADADDTPVLATTCPTIHIETNPVAILNYCAVNYAWTPVRTTFVSLHPIGGYVGESVIQEGSTGVVGRGEGIDVKFLEYKAQGFDGHGNYRESALTGLGTMITDYQTDISKMYDLYFISWSNNVTGGWNMYKDTMRLVIATEQAEDDSDVQTELDALFLALSQEYNFHYETIS